MRIAEQAARQIVESKPEDEQDKEEETKEEKTEEQPTKDDKVNN